jgi:hypothetical protein
MATWQTSSEHKDINQSSCMSNCLLPFAMCLPRPSTTAREEHRCWQFE